MLSKSNYEKRLLSPSDDQRRKFEEKRRQNQAEFDDQDVLPVNPYQLPFNSNQLPIKTAIPVKTEALSSKHLPDLDLRQNMGKRSA